MPDFVRYTPPAVLDRAAYLPDPDELRRESWYIEFDTRAGRLAIDSTQRGDGVPPDVWHNVVLRLSLPGAPDAPRIVQYLRGDEAQTLLARVDDAHEIEWGGNNHKGSLTEDGELAIEELQQKFVGMVIEDLSAWDTSEWMQDVTHDAEGRRLAGLSDEQLEAFALNLASEANANGIVLVNAEIIDILKERRNHQSVNYQTKEVNSF